MKIYIALNGIVVLGVYSSIEALREAIEAGYLEFGPPRTHIDIWVCLGHKWCWDESGILDENGQYQFTMRPGKW